MSNRPVLADGQRLAHERQLWRLKQMAELKNDGALGNDSKKRAAAIEVLAGPADGEQTDRLIGLAIAILEARGGKM